MQLRHLSTLLQPSSGPNGEPIKGPCKITAICWSLNNRYVFLFYPYQIYTHIYIYVCEHSIYMCVYVTAYIFAVCIPFDVLN